MKNRLNFVGRDNNQWNRYQTSHYGGLVSPQRTARRDGRRKWRRRPNICVAQLLRRSATLCYSGLVEEQLSLGEYIRRLRRVKAWSLQQLADETDVSYTHLSRIENDSTLPGTEIVVKLADALDGDLKAMLLKAEAVPQQILDRMTETAGDSRSTTLLRRANVGKPGDPLPERVALLSEFLTGHFALDRERAMEIAHGVDTLASLPAEQQTLLITLIQNMRGAGGGHTG